MNPSGDAQSPDLSKVTVFASLDTNSSSTVDYSEAKSQIVDKCTPMGTFIPNQLKGAMSILGVDPAAFVKSKFNALTEKVSSYSDVAGQTVDKSEEAKVKAELDKKASSDIADKVSNINLEVLKEYNNLYQQATELAEMMGEDVPKYDIAQDSIMHQKRENPIPEGWESPKFIEHSGSSKDLSVGFTKKSGGVGLKFSSGRWSGYVTSNGGSKGGVGVAFKPWKK